MKRLRRLERAFAGLVYAWLVGCDCAPVPVADAGAPSDASLSDAPHVCTPRDECPPGCNWTPCGCATDNHAVSCE